MSDKAEYLKLAEAFFAAARGAAPTTFGGVPMVINATAGAGATTHPFDENARRQELADASTSRTLQAIGDVYANLAKQP